MIINLGVFARLFGIERRRRHYDVTAYDACSTSVCTPHHKTNTERSTHRHKIIWAVIKFSELQYNTYGRKRY